jgi:hypothetical protein
VNLRATPDDQFDEMKSNPSPGGMAMPYHHTQRAILIVAVCLASAVFAAATVWQSGQWPAGIVPIALIAAALVFSSLTVEVNGKELRWYFGPGFWTYRLSRDEIQSVAVVRNHWWNGFGIRMRPGFRLYNVSGLDAVELRLKSGGVRRIGTNDPDGLSASLNSQAGVG